ncbi:hypothetical protein [Candidatus Phyllobacterium onerii]|uniref:hypothetical protein n=1 Tax=Candidatus Phyllobacterium onerii TaxID=3020828 RepID=UPI00232C9F27|nr:hypothetical protein [Phyllobacterium sp. IY22]
MDSGSRFISAIDIVSIETVEREAWLDLFAAAPRKYADAADLRYQRSGASVVLADRSVPIVEFNRGMCIGVERPESEKSVDAMLEWLRNHADPQWALQISPASQPAEIHAWTADRGLAKKGNGWAKFYRDSTTPISPRNSDLSVRSVKPHDAMSFGDVVQKGFGLPSASSAWFARLVARPKWSTYLAYEGTLPVAAGALFVDGNWAWLGIDATLPDYRGRGAQTSLIARRIQDGLANGVGGFTAETGQPEATKENMHISFRNYLKAGFVRAYVRWNYR